MNKHQKLIQQLNTSPEKIEFSEVIEIIDTFYTYTATGFINGSSPDAVVNAAGENEGSCKIFAFAKLNQLNESQTLHCFGQYYRNDVLQHPEGHDHANIRCFMTHGWQGIHYDKPALQLKAG